MSFVTTSEFNNRSQYLNAMGDAAVLSFPFTPICHERYRLWYTFKIFTSGQCSTNGSYRHVGRSSSRIVIGNLLC